MSQLKEYLNHVSHDVNNDMKMFRYVTSSSFVQKLKMQALHIAGYSNINVVVQPFAESYSAPRKDGRGFIISIDPIQAYCPGEPLNVFAVKCQGILAHEAGHIAFSDFDIFGKVSKKSSDAQKQIPILADGFTKLAEPDKSEREKEIKKAMFDYIYGEELKIMLNSLEDGGVEHAVPEKYPRFYGSIVALRNSLVNRERKEHKEAVAKGIPLNMLKTYIMEMRHYATYGYREPHYTPDFLPAIFDEAELQEIKDLCIYSRLSTKNTKERLACSEVLLDMLYPVIEEKVDTYFDQYKSALEANVDNLINEMESDMCPSHSELGINSQVNPNMAGKTTPQQSTSDYEMSLPESLKDKIQEKMKEKNSYYSTKSGGNSNSQESNSGEPNDSTQENESEAGSSSSENPSEKETLNSENESSENEDAEGSESSKDTDATDASSKNEDGEKEEGAETGSGETENSTTETSEEEIPYSASTEAAKATNAYNESLSKMKKELEKLERKDFKNAVQPNGTGKTPTLSEQLGSPNSISECHTGIKVNYYPSKVIQGCSYSGQKVKGEESKYIQEANTFSKSLKEILMYQAKIRRKNGLKNGKLNDAALSRIVTDQRVFRKKINGIEKKARISVLIDLSGSMHGEKVRDAIAAAFVLATACAKIKVPVSVMGHNTDCDAVNLYHFVEFENYLQKDVREKIFNAEAEGSNRDGLAIFHATSDLIRHRKRDEELVLLVISDGAPAHYGYSGQYADEDIRQIYNSFKKEFNVKTIGIGIGSDVRHIPNIYNDYILVPNVSSLGKELLKILKSLLV